MKLHAQVIFIGDRPNVRTNRHVDVPFVGTKSYGVLLQWMYRMDVDITCVYLLNAYTPQGELVRLPLDSIRASGTKVVALGANAREAVANQDIKFFMLPHPSGLNRDLNDKKALSIALAKCREYIYAEPRD